MLRDLLARRTSTAQAVAAGSDVQGTSRRTLITRGLWLIAGAVGVGVAGTGVVTATKPSVAPVANGILPALGGGSTNVSLFVRDVRFATTAGKPGSLPEGNIPASPHGQLWDATGDIIGNFSGGMLPGSGGQIAVQRFTFTDGSLIGMGSGSLDGEEYAIVGGTGRFAGAVGTYRTMLQPGAFGRDAEFVINIAGKG